MNYPNQWRIQNNFTGMVFSFHKFVAMVFSSFVFGLLSSQNFQKENHTRVISIPETTSYRHATGTDLNSNISAIFGKIKSDPTFIEGKMCESGKYLKHPRSYRLGVRVGFRVPVYELISRRKIVFTLEFSTKCCWPPSETIRFV